ncbi:MAG: SOS response-associated peptidase [Candidatus Moranbacteria bacterium]|nr:SOS response-associated peptidase [Candidatus Moranbacteria bacterium]
MCGRFSLISSREDLEKRFDVKLPKGRHAPRYNAAPSQDMLVIPQESPHEARFYHWGLVPVWAKDPRIGSHLINARSETVAEKPIFKRLLQKHRCLVLADGFYEWDTKGPKKLRIG